MIMGGFHYFKGSDEAGASYEAVHPLTYKDVISMLKNKLPLPTEEEIKDRSKSDWLAKTIALFQTLWFVMQCIARHIEKLPTTELEIVTLAYTAINVGMFIAWWDKPRNVDRPIRVFQKPVEKDVGKSVGWFEGMSKVIEGSQDDQVDLHDRVKVPMFYSGKPANWEVYAADCITLVGGVVFGAVHCIAWSFDFPSHTERFLWRLSSIAITSVPVLLSLFIGILYLEYLHLRARVGIERGSISTVIVMMAMPFTIFIFIPYILLPLLGMLYVAARLTTVALAFIDLASLPPGAFQTVHWTTLFLHL
jgi:hypothetical protein